MKLGDQVMRDLKILAINRQEEAIASVVQLIDDMDQRLELAKEIAALCLIDVATIMRVIYKRSKGVDVSTEFMLRAVSTELVDAILRDMPSRVKTMIDKMVKEATGD